MIEIPDPGSYAAAADKDAVIEPDAQGNKPDKNGYYPTYDQETGIRHDEKLVTELGHIVTIEK